MKITIDGKERPIGGDGATFRPEVSADGELSWTNNGGLDNPEPVNIRGPQGVQGEPGIQGPPGPAGVGSATEVYSTEETRVGTWIDGKPLYRKCFEVVFPSSSSAVVRYSKKECELKRIFGHTNLKNGTFLNIPSYYSSGNYIGLIAQNEEITISLSRDIYYGATSVIVIEYTKTTD